MGNFIAKAYLKTAEVHVDFLRDKGLIVHEGEEPYSDYLVVENGQIGTIHAAIADQDGFINCAKFATPHEQALLLFLELAKMRDDTDKQQWYKTDWGFFKAEDTNHVLREARCCMDRCKSIGSVHKLTPLELAEAVMCGDVKL